MSITYTTCTSFKVELLTGTHAFSAAPVRADTTADVFKIALYTGDASLGASTTAYTTDNEASGTGYTAGGETLTVSTAPTPEGTTALLDFSDVTWAAASFSTRAALIYNSTQGNKAVAVLDFGENKVPSSANFKVQFPNGTAASAIVRIG